MKAVRIPFEQRLGERVRLADDAGDRRLPLAVEDAGRDQLVDPCPGRLGVHSARADRRAKDLAVLRAARAIGWRPADEKVAVQEITGLAMAKAAAEPEPGRRPAGDASARASAALEAAFATAEPGPAEGITSGLLAQSDAIRLGWIEQVRRTIADLEREGGRLQDLPGRLLGLYPELATDELAGLIAQAIVLADLTGRAEVLDEAGE